MIIPKSILFEFLDSEQPQTLNISGLKGSSKAYFTSWLANFLKPPHDSLLVITSDWKKAQDLYQDISFFLGLEKEKNPWVRLNLFPSWDLAPYDKIPPHPRIVSQRMEALYYLSLKKIISLTVAPVQAIMQRVIPAYVLRERVFYLFAGAKIERDEFAEKLLENGYTRVTVVEELGEFCIRGGIIDVFPPLYEDPTRIELLGDEVESLRFFDPSTQRSLKMANDLTLLPLTEIILSDSFITQAVEEIERKWEEKCLPQKVKDKLVESIKEKNPFPGIDSLLPLFYGNGGSIFDYLPPLQKGGIIMLDEPYSIEAEASKFWETVEEERKRARIEGDFSCLAPDFYIPPHELNRSLKAFPNLMLDPMGISSGSAEYSFDVHSNEDISTLSPPPQPSSLEGEGKGGGVFFSEEGLLAPFVDKIKKKWEEEGWIKDILLISPSLGDAVRMKELLIPYGLKVEVSGESFPLYDRRDLYREKTKTPRILILMGRISSGFHFPQKGIWIITEEEIFSEKRRRGGHRKVSDLLISLEDLQERDYVVHVDHGIGMYKGLINLTIDGSMKDFLFLEYAEGDRLYIPVERINLVRKYIGCDNQLPCLDKLGGKSWQITKARAKEAIHKMAKEILEIDAKRRIMKGFSFSRMDQYYNEFEATFGYEETLDQRKAIEDVLFDMENEKPMDRLICGDVGFGKTEVAIRSAFKAVFDGKQVAMLVPTTVLALQHFQTFSQRFQRYPIKVDFLTRFKTRKEQKEILKDLEKGNLDVIIGTHRLLQKDVVFRDLGLLIIDEEQRFGVADKEKIKKLRATVDVLTLTATPIPRTLQMALAGIRDMSVIITPPADRLSIKTRVAKFQPYLIKDAISREMNRGGQVLFIHNRVRSIHSIAKFLKKLVPGVNLAVAHGQMEGRELERIMLDFMAKKIGVLVCTTIIENGMDLPAANTIIITRADQFGLAQLYQLRGRVGRSKQQAYAYLLIPGTRFIPKDAQKRLKTLQEFTELGSGFRIALKDLEIRGAGNLLGRDQSGHIAAVGLDLYMQILEETIRELKGEELPKEVEPEINLPIQAYIPEEFIEDPAHRLIFYRKLSTARSEEEVLGIEAELIDRFGRIPLQVKNLLEVSKLRIFLKKLSILSLRFKKGEIVMAFHDGAKTSPEKILNLIGEFPHRFRFTPDHRLIIKAHAKTGESIMDETRGILARL